MGENQAGQNGNVFLLAGIAILSCLLLHFIYKTLFGNKKKDSPKYEVENNSEAVVEGTPAETAAVEKTSGKNKKRAQWKGKTEYNHPWLLKNLKGHPGNVLLVDTSANGKFLAATCDEPIGVAAVQPAAAPRRRKPSKHRRRSSATPSPPPPPSPSQNMSTEQLAEALRPHLLTMYNRWNMGYPVEADGTSNKATAYIHPPPRPKPHHMTLLDANAPEFVPGSQSDSGRGSYGSSPRSESDEEMDAVERVCVRCDNVFLVTTEGEYVLSQSKCYYHPGRLTGGHYGHYSCCNGHIGSKPCVTKSCHVWSGTHPGMNFFDGYVRARTARGGIYAIDCEMVYTTAGLELAYVAVLSPEGRTVYKSKVKPSAQILDLNTQYSGLRQRDIEDAKKSLREVQNELLGFIGSDTILVGHALENDLRALKLIHSAVIDTCDMYPHARGFPLRRSLRALAAEYLGRTIQNSSKGHRPIEDARAAMDLVLLKVQEQRAQQARYFHPLPVLQPYDVLINRSNL